MKTFHPKQKEIKRETHVLDAQGEILGRFSSKIIQLLTGKSKSYYSPHLDCGDFVKVINAEKIKLTGNKSSDKVYRSVSGYPGGFKEVNISKLLNSHPERIIKYAVNGMLPDNKLKRERLKRLTILIGNKDKT